MRKGCGECVTDCKEVLLDNPSFSGLRWEMTAGRWPAVRGWRGVGQQLLRAVAVALQCEGACIAKSYSWGAALGEGMRSTPAPAAVAATAAAAAADSGHSSTKDPL